MLAIVGSLEVIAAENVPKGAGPPREPHPGLDSSWIRLIAARSAPGCGSWPYAGSPDPCSIVERQMTASKVLGLSQSSTRPSTERSRGCGSAVRTRVEERAVTSYPRDASESAIVLSAAPTSRIVAPASSLPSARKA